MVRLSRKWFAVSTVRACGDGQGVSPAIPYLVVKNAEVASLLEQRVEHILNALFVSDDRPNLYPRGQGPYAPW